MRIRLAREEIRYGWIKRVSFASDCGSPHVLYLLFPNCHEGGRSYREKNSARAFSRGSGRNPQA